MSKGYVIFSNGLASKLLGCGCDLLNVREDRKIMGNKVYVFKDNSKLKFYMNKFRVDKSL